MIKITQHTHWNESATTGLGETLRDDITVLQDQVNSKVAQLWEMGSPHGTSWMITRTEQLADKKELVICCYKGCDVNTVMQVVIDSAIEQGFDSIRYHTQRKGLNRLVSELNFKHLETVYQKQLSNIEQREAS
ncbi:MAG: hypothetical protein KTR20_15155 [Cellvibrionaceae bacterium]|nr:hypothetical protein [Cellvibrionaceae bacterium]